MRLKSARDKRFRSDPFHFFSKKTLQINHNHCHHKLTPFLKNLQDELECSKDYKHFQFEELQSLKKKLDKETRKAEAALKDKQESEEVIARLERELKSVR